MIHNELFPATALRLEGFVDNLDKQSNFPILPVVSQHNIVAKRGASRDKVRARMEKIGFENTGGDDYFHRITNVRVDDLHGENVFETTTSLAFVDPSISMDHATKLVRLRAELERREAKIQDPDRQKHGDAANHRAARLHMHSENHGCFAPVCAPWIDNLRVL